MSVVLDSSVTLSWYFSDERTDATTAVLNRVADDGAMVPTLWRLEVANGLQMALRRGRIDAVYRDASLRSLGALPIELDGETERHAWAATLGFADRFDLTLYDAAYLELAVRIALPLATLDLALARAAAQVNVQVIGTS